MDKNIDIRLTTTPDLKMAAVIITCNVAMEAEDIEYALQQYLEAYNADENEELQ